MDAYQPPPPNMRPPPAPADPYHQYYPTPVRPPPPQGASAAWYPYPPSPSPPQWGPPPPPPPPHAFPALPQQPSFSVANSTGHFPPLPPRLPYPNQEWGHHSWGYHQGHASPANSNAEDWAVKAREWAASKAAAAEDQHSQSASNAPNGAREEAHQQYPDNGYQDVHQPSVPGLSYQQFPVPLPTQPNYQAVDGSLPGGLSAGFPHQETLSTSSAVHQQEVPSSYSSVAGKEESCITSQSAAQISVPGAGGPVSAVHPYVYGDQTAAPPSSLNDQPLQFTARTSSDYASLHSAWPHPSAADVAYPPIPSSLPSQHDPSMVVPPISGHSMPPFGRFPPPNFQSTVTSVGPPYGFGAKSPLPPAVAFMDDTYAASAMSERPKKAPVPAWLKEEILKNKTSLGKSSSANPLESESVDDDFLDKPLRNPDLPDAKSFSSSKFTDGEEEEGEDEDDVEAARTAAINLEIKRILTEVLLKVTDELFDEIATKVISEDDTITEADQMHQASAKILVPPRGKESETEGASRKASSVSPGDVLGLVSYASDDDDDIAYDDGHADTNGIAGVDGSDGAQSSQLNSSNGILQQFSAKKLPEHNVASDARFELEIQTSETFPKNNKSSLDKYSEKCGSRVSDDKAEVCTSKVLDRRSCSGHGDDASQGSGECPEGTESHKDTTRNYPHTNNAGLKSDGSGKSLHEDSSRERGRADDKDTRKEKADHRNGSRDKTKQNDLKLAEKDKGFESNEKFTTHRDAKKDRSDRERPKRTSSKEDGDRKREREKEEDRSRHKYIGDTSKDKRRRSSPTSDESSDDSRRKTHSRRRNLSPSPVRSRRRHVSRSPHSKHSQRRHSPYSSLDASRGRRSPERRHRE